MIILGTSVFYTDCSELVQYLTCVRDLGILAPRVFFRKSVSKAANCGNRVRLNQTAFSALKRDSFERKGCAEYRLKSV